MSMNIITEGDEQRGAMAPAVNQPAIGSVDGVTITAETNAGAAWVKKYTHPPVELDSTYVGTPDMANAPSSHVEWRMVQNTSPAADTAGFPAFSSDILMLQTSGAATACYVWKRNSTGQWQQDNASTGSTGGVFNSSYDYFNQWNQDASVSRLAYKSCTHYLNATEFANQGTVTVAQFRPNILVDQQGDFLTASAVIGRHQDDPALYKRLLKLFCPKPKVVPKAKRAPNEDAYEYVHKEEDEQTPRVPTSHLDAIFNYQVQIVDLGVNNNGIGLPETPTELMELSPKATTRMAKDGAFVVQGWSQPTNLFKEGTSVGGGRKCPPTCFWKFCSGTGVLTYYPFIASGALMNNFVAIDTPWSDFTWAWIYWSGLSAPAAGASPAYITTKCLIGVEVQPNLQSAWTPFVKQNPIPDDRALRMAAGIRHQMPDSMPASANDLGSILLSAVKYAPMAINWIKSVFAKNGPTQAMAEAVNASNRKNNGQQRNNNRANNNRGGNPSASQLLRAQKRGGPAPTQPRRGNPPGRSGRVTPATKTNRIVQDLERLAVDEAQPVRRRTNRGGGRVKTD